VPRRSPRVALITGITGQDGSWLAELLLEKGYQVHGLVRRASLSNLGRIQHLLDAQGLRSRLVLHYGDMTDPVSLSRIIQETHPGEIYNLAAQSHVHYSFDSPEATADVDALGVLRVLEAVRNLELKDTRIYQASTSEMYGNAPHSPQNELTPFSPCSPYATAKLYAYWVACSYRQAYDMHVVNGILFNHESERRGHHFVTRKISAGLAALRNGSDQVLELGNLEARRDWGHAREYMEAVWLMMQQDKPSDYVVATGTSHTGREFVEACAEALELHLEWRGEAGLEEGIEPRSGRVLVRVSADYFRPAELNALCGDSSKARQELGWEARIRFPELATLMARHDDQCLRRAAIIPEV